jgi:hypothetical protein
MLCVLLLVNELLELGIVSIVVAMSCQIVVVD